MRSAGARNFLRWCPQLGLAFTLFTAACSGGNDTKADAGGAGDGAAPGDPSQEIGAFLVQLDTSVAPPQTGFLGFVRSAGAPPLIGWRMTAQEGPCKLVVPEIPFCNPACTSGQLCSGDTGRCVSQPVARNAGRVRVRGLITEAGPQEISMTAMGALMDYQLPTGLRLAYPPFAPDGRVELDAEGGDVGAFSLSTRAIAPLDVPASGTPVVRRSAGYALRWTAPPAGATSVIQAVFDLSLHAGTKGKLECHAARHRSPRRARVADGQAAGSGDGRISQGDDHPAVAGQRRRGQRPGAAVGGVRGAARADDRGSDVVHRGRRVSVRPHLRPGQAALQVDHARLPDAGVGHRGPGLLRPGRFAGPSCKSPNGDVVGRADEGHVPIARRAVDGDAPLDCR